MKRRNGFTLIELMIVVAIIAIIASIAIPNLLSARLNANETSAISTLRTISSAEAQFQASGRGDVDRDGSGEFGFLSELAGGLGVRVDPAGTRGSVLNPPVLSGAFRTLDSAGRVSRSGYLFAVCLPGVAGSGTREQQDGTLTADVDADLTETTWCAYGEPSGYARSGQRVFFCSQAGDVTAKDDGTGTYPTMGAAFVAGGDPNNVTGKVAVGTRGRDGGLWRPVN